MKSLPPYKDQGLQIVLYLFVQREGRRMHFTTKQISMQITKNMFLSFTLPVSLLKNNIEVKTTKSQFEF